ncbi:MAG TPA: glycosyl transferase family protein [Bryobacteraceae bacterium]|nr:glycosyl transferase family protein [Bryobacteraceae bacterium]
MTLVDQSIGWLILPLAVWFLVSGVDDFVVDFTRWLLWGYGKIRKQYTNNLPSDDRLADLPEKKIAIVVPLWREYTVIRHMVEHNNAAIRYSNYHFFIGGYPNDDATLDAVRELEDRFPNVHLALCPHDGPTSKADCLNWIYQRILLYEQGHAEPFDVLVTHDAEDLIHPQSLLWINFYAGTHDMIQIPVLPLSTPFLEWTHGVYRDEFCEYQSRDMPVRQFMGAFVPSCGVGTGFTRGALDRLAVSESNRIFEPACLTEDYENGFRLRLQGARQMFVPVTLRDGSFLATRELFPHSFYSAVRQRTRWVTGIALQGWERHGWSGGLAIRYWLWRDRKGLVGNPLSLLGNAIFLYGAGTWLASRVAHSPWGLGGVSPAGMPAWLLPLNGVFGGLRLLIRFFCVGRICGWSFAAGVPLRTVLANLINSAASLAALHQYFRARLRHEPLRWLKTEHAYPSLSALKPHKPKLGQVLVGSCYISEGDLHNALDTQPSGTRLGEHLIALGCLSEDDLYEGLSLQQSLPLANLVASDVEREVARSFPSRLLKDWRVLPFKVQAGSLYVAGPELPTDELQRALRPFSTLEIRFHLITPSGFE